MIRYVGFPAAESSYINEANWYRDMFENALREAVRLANGNVGENVLRSIILPLLADHVLLEANHYLRLLEAK